MTVRKLIGPVLLVGLGLAACSQPQAGPKGEKGDPGPAGAQGPAGPSGTQGPAGASASFTFTDMPCSEVSCSASCKEGQRAITAYGLGPGGVIVYADERSVTFRPRRPPGRAVLICAPSG
jgi:hypothetical protein